MIAALHQLPGRDEAERDYLFTSHYRYSYDRKLSHKYPDV